LFVSEKKHLFKEGKETMIQFRKMFIEIFENPKPANPSVLTYSWLLGFIEGDASFSTSGLTPRLKFENTMVEENLFKQIKTTLGLDITLQYPKLRERGLKEKAVVVLDYHQVEFLNCIILPIFSKLTWHTKKK